VSHFVGSVHVGRLIPSHSRGRDTLSTASRTCGQALELRIDVVEHSDDLLSVMNPMQPPDVVCSVPRHEMGMVRNRVSGLNNVWMDL
jgi:hypothetical protein